MPENNYQFRERMRKVHTENLRDFHRRPSEKECEVTMGWEIVVPDFAGDVILNAARDLLDYFFVSQKLSLTLVRESARSSDKAIIYRISSLPERNYEIIADFCEIILSGCDERAAAQAGYFLEDTMNFAKAPFIGIGNYRREQLFSPRMVHSGYGLDMYPDEHLRAIAHAGMDAILVFVEDIDITPHGYLDFNELISRAEGYGIDVYAYSYMLSKIHPSAPGAREFYENLYGRLFERCPGFRGIIFVGESCEFPSRDPHTTGKLRRDNLDENGQPIIKDKVSPGWWPCCDFPEWMNLIRDVILSRKPDCDIVLWSYNWGYVEEKYRLELIRNLPKDVSLLVTFEMFEDVVREGVTNRTVDYSLFFEGPGKYFISEAKLAKELGIRLYAMTNTGGLTWDVGVIPFEPAPYQWLKRYRAMLSAHDDWGLCGLMESHHYGFYPSFISDFAKIMFTRPEENADNVLEKIAERDFGKDNVKEILRAFSLFSEGINDLVSTNEDQYGPFRVGPSYPLVLFRPDGVVFPSVPYAHFGGNEICDPDYKYDLSTKKQLDKIQYEMKCYEKVSNLFAEGSEIIEKALPSLGANEAEKAKRLFGITRFVSNTAKTAVNVKKWKILKEKLRVCEKEHSAPLAAEMKQIALDEIENAKNTIQLVNFDSRLGYEPSMEYMCDAAHIEWKIAVTRKVIEDELEPLL